MSDISILPDASSRMTVDPGTAPLLTGAASWGGEIYFNANAANGQYEVPIHVWGVAANNTFFELFRTPPDASGGAGDVPNHLYMFFRTSAQPTGAGTSVDLGDSTALYGKWIHFAWTQSAALAGNFYAAIEGFTPGSPTYLITPSRGTVTSAATRIQAGAEKSDSTTVCLTTSIARLWATEAELTEAQISGASGVWTNRTLPAAVTGNDYTGLACNDHASPATAAGNPGNWTLTGTWSTGRAVQPTSWPALPTTARSRLLLGVGY